MNEYRDKIENSIFVSQNESGILDALNRQLEYASFGCKFYAPLREFLPLGSPAELDKLPFSSAEDIRERGRDMLCVPASRIQRIVSLFSSGTTLEPKRIYFSEGDLGRTVDFFAEGMGWMCHPGDSVAVLLPCSVPDGVGDLLSRGLEKLGCTPLRLGLVESPSDYAETLLREKPSVLVGMPWQVRLLALALPELRPGAVLLSADYVPESIYSFLEKIWGCRVLSHFGMTETCFGAAVESMLHRGMYLRRDELYAEIIDPKSGRSLPPGEVGELVITTLRREAMPLIRYRSGDLARISPDREGVIERVYGRRDVSPAFYALQEALCPRDELLDYSLLEKGSGEFFIDALVTDGCPDCFSHVIRSTAAQVLGAASEKISVKISRCRAMDARMYTTGKRIQM